MYFQEGKSFILLKLSTQALSKHLSKAEKEKLNCSVVFQPISQLQYWAEKMAIGLWFFLFFLSALSTFQMDQLTPIHVSLCLHFHLLVHLFTRVQRAAFSSEKWLKEQKRKIGKGQGVWSRAEPYPSDIKAYSDPWNTIKPAPLAPLGQAAK